MVDNGQLDDTATKWIIKDWMDNVCFNGRTFSSFDEGWAYIYENDPQPESHTEDNWFDDYYVEPTE